MTYDRAINLLIDNGYKKEPNSMFDEIQYYKRITGSDCNLNDRPPSIVVTFHSFKDQWSMKVNLRAETVAERWVDLGYYALDIDELDSLSEMEYLISKSWEAFN